MRPGAPHGAVDAEEPRYLLVADPATTSLEPLVQRLLIERDSSLERFWGNTGMAVLKLADVLPRPGGEPAVALGFSA